MTRSTAPTYYCEEGFRSLLLPLPNVRSDSFGWGSCGVGWKQTHTERKGKKKDTERERDVRERYRILLKMSFAN